MTIRLSAIALAGGLSSRMGQDKALLQVEGQPLLQRICTIAAELADVVYVVTPWGDRYQPFLPPHCQIIQEHPLSTPTPILPISPIPPTSPTSSISPTSPKDDQHKQTQGPLIGFSQGLSHVQTEWVLLLACDLLKLRQAPLQRAIAQLEQLSPETLAFLARDQKGWQPLCGFYRQACRETLETFIQQGGRSFQTWLATQRVEEWHLSDRQILFNCNTPEDL